MEHNFTLISTLAWGLCLALIFGFLANRFRMPALVGYLLAGICIAPTTPGFVGDVALASQLSELGVTLLMFGVGLHFSIDKLMRVKRIAIPGALLQMATATLLGGLLAYYWDWSWLGAGIFGLSLSCASTVVLIRALQGLGVLESGEGQVAVGWLIVEDLATVLLLVLLPSLASVMQETGTLTFDRNFVQTLLETFVLIIGFITTMMVVGRRILPWALMQAVKTGSREIFTLCVIAIAIGVAYASTEIFHVSFALGAFFAGMMMRESEYAHRAAQDTLPLQDAFSVIFFLGVGMLFDPTIIIREPLSVLGVLAIIILGKALVSIAIVRALGYNWRYALTIGASLAQVGEFSFILGGLGVSLGFLPAEGMTLILAGAIFSIALNPLVFHLMKPLLQYLAPEEVSLPSTENRPTQPKQKGPVVIVGANCMGQHIFKVLTKQHIPCVVIEQKKEIAENENTQNHFIFGDASHPETLDKAGIAHASCLIVTITDSLITRKIIDESRVLNPNIHVVALMGQEGDYEFFKETDGTILPNIHFLDTRKEMAQNILSYTMHYYRKA